MNIAKQKEKKKSNEYQVIKNRNNSYNLKSQSTDTSKYNRCDDYQKANVNVKYELREWNQNYEVIHHIAQA